MNGCDEFRMAIHNTGMTAPDEIVPDGQIHRFASNGKRNDDSGWYVFHDDGIPAGAFGDWRSGESKTWRANTGRALSAQEEAAHKARVEAMRRAREADDVKRKAEARQRAEIIWQAAIPASDDHPYLARKGVKAHGLRVHNEALISPIRDDGKLHSLQFIEPDGSKRFLTGGRVSGCYFGIGRPEGVVCIAEGFATGASIHEATGFAVAIAFYADNLLPVAKALRKKYPDFRLILCADDDYRTEGNPGKTKATEATRAVGASLAVPDFGENRSEKDTDFNDMAARLGLQAVERAITSATIPDTTGLQSDEEDAPAANWPEPLPLVAKVKPEPYPLDALPDTIRAAVQEVHSFAKAPVPLVASSALAAVSLAIQAHADVKRADKLTGPASLFLLTIADSGERKSTCDGFFIKAIRDYEEAQAEIAKPALKNHKADIDAWDAKRGGIKEKIRQLAKDSKPTVNMEAALRALEHDKPEPPRVPRLLYADATPEALAYGLAKHWPSGGVVSAEAGIVLGAHGMGKDSVMRNLALLNVLWDGGNLTIDRRSAESFVVRGARLTVGLQVQEATLRSFFDRSGGLARGTGFLARFLVAWPESTQGFRLFSEGPRNWPALATFNRRIAAILEQPVPIGEDGALSPPLLPLTAEAKAAWVVFHDVIENELASGGELYDVRDVASKTADNAARLAGLFQVFEGAGGAIGLEAFEAASRVVAWHLTESRRFFGELALPAELADAARMDTWLIEYCRRERVNLVPIAKLQQGGPWGLRSKATIDTAMRELGDAGRARSVKEGKRKMIAVNPILLIAGGTS